MTILQSIPAQPIDRPLADKQVMLHYISWDAYQKILEALGEKRSALLT